MRPSLDMPRGARYLVLAREQEKNESLTRALTEEIVKGRAR